MKQAGWVSEACQDARKRLKDNGNKSKVLTRSFRKYDREAFHSDVASCDWGRY